MRILTLLASIAAAFAAVPALAQSPIAEANAARANYDTDGAIAILDTACKAGNGEACWRLALSYDESFGEDNEVAAQKQYLANCAKGDGRSCYMLYRAIPYDASEKDKAKGQVALNKACDGGLAFACVEFGNSLAYNEKTQGDKAAIVGYYEKGCTLGSREGCSEASKVYGDTYENPLTDVTKAIALGRKACDMGNGEACGSLVELEQSRFEDGVFPDDAKQRWQDYLQKACVTGDSSRCADWLTGQIDMP